MEEINNKIEKLNNRFNSIEDKFNSLMEAINKTIEENKEVLVKDNGKQIGTDDLIFKTYEIVKRMDFHNERRIWEERAKECENKIKKLKDEKRHIDYEMKEVEDRYYRDF